MNLQRTKFFENILDDRIRFQLKFIVLLLLLKIKESLYSFMLLHSFILFRHFNYYDKKDY